ncbi:serine/threonine protein kinase [Thermogemmatispora sp.]|uniref:serine/threonine protein kinase n=1 Tax=Thermogemmatispora sp. TaxID=1968838 RepID=UPI001D284EAE|nr:serine/threonine-protein kinase [Thermogemmatispora sp.]MBX5451769.1 serine/threonine protein kinase [Thermogemmatispora sp.]
MAGLEGKTLERYELRRLIGKGGMADVYEGYDLAVERTVAVKVFKREDEELLRRFIREARLMAALKHEHLVPIYDTGSGQIDGLTWYYIVMPFMEGGTLRARIRQGPLPLSEACRSLREIAAALDYIHRQGIIHRDIKSSNVLLDAEGHCYLSDFGIARTTSDATQLTSTGNVLGTVEYVAPELFEGDNRANVRSDLYSLGVLLFEMVTGRLPFTAENPIAVVTMHISKPPPPPHLYVPHISPAVEHVILKGLEKRPERRYSSASELAEAFCQAVTSGSRALVTGATHQPYQDWAQVSSQSAGAAGTPQPLVLRSVGSVHTPAPPQPTSYPLTGQVYSPAPVLSPTGTGYAGYGQPPSSTASTRRGLLLASLALVLLLAISLPLALAIFSSPHQGTNGSPTVSSGQPSGQQQQTPTATPNLTATAQAQASATAQAQAQATQTAIAGATATVQAQASATAAVWQTATAGRLVYSDALTNAENPATRQANWDRSNHCLFGGDGYHVVQAMSLTTSQRICHEVNYSYGNIALSVQMKILSGASGGVLIRLGTNLFNLPSGYLFEVDSQGRYRIAKFNGGLEQPFTDWTTAPALQAGTGVQNTLQIIADGSSLSFYANNVYLTTINDSSYTEGNIGFLGVAGDNDANVVYSNLAIYALS